MKCSYFVFLYSLCVVNAIDPLVFKGSKVFNSKTGQQFYFKGLAYQPKQGVTFSPQDPLADEVGCKRDIELFKDLGINSIRVYEVDSTKNHDVCMKALADAGIYVILDLPTPLYSISRENPSWDIYLLNKYKMKVDAFYKYSNVAGFIAGNEVTNTVDTTPASAFVKASLRDIKSYMKSKNINLPVGYADNDDELIRDSLIKYFNCGDEPLAIADFYGVNTYRWCGNNNYSNSGYGNMIAPFSNYSVPYLLTEYGCNTITPRIFSEVASIYGSDMENLTSGGFLFEYSEEPNNYGLVKVSFGSSNVEKLSDYDTFKKQVSNVDPKGTSLKDYNPSLKNSQCPPVTSSWKVNDVLPPSPNIDVCNCLSESFSCSLPAQFDPSNAVQSKALGDTLSFICGTVDCSDVSTDTAKGVYGKYSGCTSIQKSNYILSTYYSSNNNDSSYCSVKGLGFDLIINSNAKKTVTCNSTGDGTVNSDPISSLGLDGSSNGNDPSSSTSPSSSSYITPTGSKTSEQSMSSVSSQSRSVISSTSSHTGSSMASNQNNTSVVTSQSQTGSKVSSSLSSTSGVDINTSNMSVIFTFISLLAFLSL
ncbi:Protein EPD1 [Smittium mucronatum]|uniref:1,3-beta-glucanosyltransferase n=1 Tax=Smittium mucronatum TaxID=133383 RepID=A0A1R0H1C8_9FUNG|nr:Protein EPD1 [Smittium mucronatum]